MSLPSRIARRLRLLTRRRGFEHDLDDELRFHIEMQAAKHAARGLSPAEARALAEREFGGVERFKDEVRDVRGATFLDDVTRDVRYGVRSLRRAPAFVAVAVLCLGLGIGANAAIFSVVDAVLLRPLPYAEPERLVRAYESMRSWGPNSTGSVSWMNYLQWRTDSRSFEELVAYLGGSADMQGRGEPERIRRVASTDNLFRTLGVKPLLGRTFLPGEEERGRDGVAVIGEAFWRRRFDGDPEVLGRTVVIDGAPRTIVGVMPTTFNFPAGARPYDVWLPWEPWGGARNNRGNHLLAVIGRLKPGVTAAQADADLKHVAARLEKLYPNEQADRIALARPLAEDVLGRARPQLLVLLGAVGLVLLIACANVANLLLARATARRREVAVRLALGASRARLVRQFLVESLLLAAGGALAGVLFARWSLSAMRPLVEGALPRADQITIDTPVLLYLLAAAVASGVLFGLVPALQSSRADVRDYLGEGAKGTSGGAQTRLRAGLVVAEIALSLVLLVGAGLLMRGFVKLRATPSGLDPHNVLTVRVGISDKVPSAERTTRFYGPVLERVRAIPGVVSAGLITLLPIQDAWTNGGYTVEGEPTPEPGKEPIAEMRMTSPGFYRSLGIPLVAGRDFEASDAATGGVVVNQAFVKRHFKNGENPIGRRVNIYGAARPIVGVVGDVRQAGLDRDPLVEVHGYFNDTTNTGWLDEMTIVLKTTVPPGSITNAVRDAVRQVDPNQPMFRVQTMDEVIAQSLVGRRLNLWLLGIFAGVALVLAAAGLYGVIAYLVAQRTREIGIRMALGAQTRDVVRLVVGQGARLAALGVAVGLAGAWALTRLLASMLYGVSARDPLTFALVPAVLATVALLATWLPARRAARVDPLLAIRSE
ncbi:MAG: ADOP family duplicated permease [Gemmatimonadaceae bacterium]